MITKNINFYSNMITFLSALAIGYNIGHVWSVLFMVPACAISYAEGIETGIKKTMEALNEVAEEMKNEKEI